MKKTEIEDTVYREEFRRHAWFPDVYIYISKNPVTCYDHIKTRNQEGDSDVSLEYLTTLNGHYNDMFRSIQCTKYSVDLPDPIFPSMTIFIFVFLINVWYF